MAQRQLDLQARFEETNSPETGTQAPNQGNIEPQAPAVEQELLKNHKKMENIRRKIKADLKKLWSTTDIEKRKNIIKLIKKRKRQIIDMEYNDIAVLSKLEKSVKS